MNPTLFLMLGYPGAGKTTVSQHVSDITGAIHIWADHERKQRYGEPSYSNAENNELYTSLNKKVSQLLKNKQSVVFDTAFNHYIDRERLAEIARTHGAQTVVLWVKAPRNIAKERAVERRERQATRVLNDKTPMRHDHFEYLSNKLEEPKQGETCIEIDGTKVTQQYIATKLHEIKA